MLTTSLWGLPGSRLGTGSFVVRMGLLDLLVTLDVGSSKLLVTSEDPNCVKTSVMLSTVLEAVQNAYLTRLIFMNHLRALIPFFPHCRN